MTRSMVLAAIAIALPVAVLAAPASPLAGRWVQSSSGTELVLKPKIKLTPSYTPSMGTSLGGSVGYGGATTTVLATEPTPVKVTRRMNLAIQPDGRFAWTIVREWTDGSCRKTHRQEKAGQVALSGDRAVFNTTEGSEVTQSSCAAETRGRLSAQRETYTVSRTAGGLRFTGPSADWTFTAG